MSDLPFDDQTDFENAERGRIDALDPCVARAGGGMEKWCRGSNGGVRTRGR